jgi:BirA family biotin operon repressor/biotin-[acetyl-CoA-carboxylase] ligase
VSIGKTLKARTLTSVIEGRALGITDDGVLKIEDKDGVIHHVYSADIEL